jgi:hypothetical protein
MSSINTISLAERMSGPRVKRTDNYWRDIHKWIVEFRHENNLSISEFLVVIGLNPFVVYFKHLACFTGSTMCPSTMKGSDGAEFREAVLNFLKNNQFSSSNISSILSSSTFSFSLPTIVGDFMLDNIKAFHELNVLNIEADKSGNVFLHDKPNLASDNDSVIALLMSEQRIKNLLPALSPVNRSSAVSCLTIQRHTETQFITKDIVSPICLKYKLHVMEKGRKPPHKSFNFGTGTVVAVSEEDPVKLTLTARHVVVGEPNHAAEGDCGQRDVAQSVHFHHDAHVVEDLQAVARGQREDLVVV